MTDQAPAVCDVLGCEEPPTGTYLDTAQGGFEFRVCTCHFQRLKVGEQPRLIRERVDPARRHSRPALILE